MLRFISAAMMMALVSCGVPKSNPENSANPADGYFSKQSLGDSGVLLSRDAKVQPGQDFNMSVTVGDATFDISLSKEGGISKFDGHGSTLSEQDKSALASAAETFAKENKLSEASPYEDQVTYKAMDYLAHAPADYVFDASKYQHQLSLKNEGVSCIKKNSTVKAEWNTLASGYVSENVVVGVKWGSGYGCMGRCGSDCGGWLPSSWTKDCMDHDACSYRNSSSGGASDSNCGDEFNEAADDWLLGVGAGCWG